MVGVVDCRYPVVAGGEMFRNVQRRPLTWTPSGVIPIRALRNLLTQQ
jgi:hypothetical protein